ncbi:MAG: ABC transporter permease [Rubrobacter sp.]|nr:ABC transporter permease [Rubrobacter sp.]
MSPEKQLAERLPSVVADRLRSQAADLPTTVIQPTHGWAPVNLRDLAQFREVLYFLVWSELKVRYKQTVLGAAWAIIHPVAIMLVFTIFFGLVVRVPTGDIPYPVFVFSGIVVWTYFSGALNQSSNSLVQYERLITKVYFPRLLIPVASIIAGLVDFAIAFMVLIGMTIFFGFMPTAAVFALPLLMLLAATIALAVSLWLSALNVQYRDVKLLIPVLVQVWFFATPIIYPSSLVPDRWHTLYELVNPMVGVVNGFRWALLGAGEPPGMILVVSALMALVLLVSGLYYFRRMERIFADVV